MFFDSSSAPLKTNRWHAFAHFFFHVIILKAKDVELRNRLETEVWQHKREGTMVAPHKSIRSIKHTFQFGYMPNDTF